MAAQPPPQILIPPPVPSSRPGSTPPPPPGGPAAAGAPGAVGPAKAPPKLGPDGKPLPPDQQPQGAPPEGEIPPEDFVHLTFWQQPWVQNVLPFLTSLAFHAAILVIGLTIWGVSTIVAAVPMQEQIIIPEAAMANEVPGGVENPGIGGDPTRPAAQDQHEENTHPDGWAPEPGESPIAEAMGGGDGDATDALIGQGPGGGFGRGGGFGSGEGDGTGGGTGTGRGRLAPFGAPGGGIPGPRGRVFGNGGNARTIAFCCDSSGSMIDKFSSLKAELAKAIEGLKPIQQFSIVFFADEKAHAFENGSLVSATPENKRKAYKWLEDLTTSGTSDPIPGLEIAFKAKPELMYILTDGDFPNNSEVLAKTEALNKGKKTRVNTIAFVTSQDDDTSESFLKFLQTLADQNGGKFKHVAQDQLDG